MDRHVPLLFANAVTFTASSSYNHFSIIREAQLNKMQVLAIEHSTLLTLLLPKDLDLGERVPRCLVKAWDATLGDTRPLPTSLPPAHVSTTLEKTPGP